MALYRTKRGKVYWMDFVFAGQRVQESTYTASKSLAKKILDKRRRDLEEGAAGVRRQERPKLFSVAAEEWVTTQAPKWAPATLAVHRLTLSHLLPVFGGKLACDIEPNVPAGRCGSATIKTAAGTGRVVPLSQRAVAALEHWAAQFPARQPERYLFPAVRIGGSGRHGPQGHRQDARFAGGIAYATDPTRPVSGIKSAWVAAKRHCGVVARFHDLRHTAASRMMEAGVPLSKIAKILGWRPSTMALMAARYGHFDLEELRQAVEAGSRPAEAKTDAYPLNFSLNSAAEKRGGRAN